MNYQMEELLPVVGRLAEKYTSFENTSMTYEKAEQLMEAVLYCIQEMELPEEKALASAKKIPAQQAYDLGIVCVENKAKEALKIYNEILPDFRWYGNRCLRDTFVKAMPEFFKWYDIRFEPQNTILTLDYPVLKDISGYTGIDKIYEFIHCICLEQEFLHKFPEEFVRKILTDYHKSYQDLADNLCEIVLRAFIRHFLAGKPLLEQDLNTEDFIKIQEILQRGSGGNISDQLIQAVRSFLEKYYDDRGELAEYLIQAVPGIVIRMQVQTI